MDYILGYVLILNFISVIICCYDKHQARKGGHRISENTLLYLSILGGGVAMYLTMRIIHHKTHHNKFMIGIPCIILCEFITVFLIYLNISGNLNFF